VVNKVKIFLGSSSESADVMRQIQEWLPPRWAEPWTGAFKSDRQFFEQLLGLTREVDGAIFVFAEDDKTSIRHKIMPTTRDNVWLEYGLFVGALGREQVRRVVLGNPRDASDLLGITVIKLPKPGETKRADEIGKMDRAKEEIRRWARRLPPRLLKRLEFDVAVDIANCKPANVGILLTNRAPAFLQQKSLTQIRALCSNKGEFSKEYYGGQFKWVSKQPVRTLRRIFVGKLNSRYGVEFSPGEVEGIKMHLAQTQKCARVEIRWMRHDEPSLGAIHGDSLGFALFGEEWFVHWGLQSGYYSSKPSDRVIGRHLGERFEQFWENALPFDEQMVKKLLR
jgi:hypothetical protein